MSSASSVEEIAPNEALPDVESIDRTLVTPETEASKASWKDHFSKMMDELSNDYMTRVMDLANQDSYSVSLRIPTGNKIPDPLDENLQVDEYKGWETRTFKRGRITTADYNKVEKLRASYNKDKDPERVADTLHKIYQYLAYCYLEMAAADFKRSDWDELKPILDGCNFKTVYSLKNSTLAARRARQQATQATSGTQ